MWEVYSSLSPSRYPCVCGWMESKVVAPNGGTPLCSLRVMVFCEAICNCALIELVFYLIRCALLILAMWKTFKQEAIKYLQVWNHFTYFCVPQKILQIRNVTLLSSTQSPKCVEFMMFQLSAASIARRPRMQECSSLRPIGPPSTSPFCLSLSPRAFTFKLLIFPFENLSELSVVMSMRLSDVFWAGPGGREVLCCDTRYKSFKIIFEVFSSKEWYFNVKILAFHNYCSKIFILDSWRATWPWCKSAASAERFPHALPSNGDKKSPLFQNDDNDLKSS